jgi:hypothetical protein
MGIALLLLHFPDLLDKDKGHIFISEPSHLTVHLESLFSINLLEHNNIYQLTAISGSGFPSNATLF